MLKLVTALVSLLSFFCANTLEANTKRPRIAFMRFIFIEIGSVYLLSPSTLSIPFNPSRNRSGNIPSRNGTLRNYFRGHCPVGALAAHVTLAVVPRPQGRWRVTPLPAPPGVEFNKSRNRYFGPAHIMNGRQPPSQTCPANWTESPRIFASITER